MAKGGGSENELGFDQKVTRSNLVTELIELGVVSQGLVAEWKEKERARARNPIDINAERIRLLEEGIADPILIDELTEDWLIENARREASTDEDIEWQVARQAGNVHAWLHGVPARINGELAAHCEKWPCMACGASYALLELCTVITEQDGVVRRTADDLAHLAQSVCRLKPRRMRAERALVLLAKEHADLAARIKLKPAPWDDGIDALRMIETVAERLNNASLRAREGARSTELRYARPGTPGRAKHWALIAMSQHLGQGGYSQARIAGVIHDDAGGTDDARLERVRHRLADVDCRSLVPSPPDK
jgi:hypothetical protein